MLGRDGGVLEKAPGVADQRRVGQFGAADLTHPIKDVLRRRLRHLGLRHLLFQIGITQHGAPGLWQGKAHAGNECPPGQPQRMGGMFKDRIAVAKAALGGIQGEGLAGLQVNRVKRLKAVLQLDPVSTHVLNRRCPDRTGNEGHVFQPGVALGQGPLDEFVPIFTRPGLDHPGPWSVAQQPPALDVDFENQGLDIASQHNIAAATQNELGRLAPVRISQHGQHIGFAAKPHQCMSPRHNVKGIARLKRDVFLD